MPHHLGLYFRSDSVIHALHPGAKMIAGCGFVAAVLLLPARFSVSAGVLALMLALCLVAARVPFRVLAARVLALSVIIGAPFLLSQLGGQATRLAGQSFAVKSLLVAGACLVLTATTRVVTMLETLSRAPGVSPIVPLAEFIVRGVDLLLEEVVKVHRAATLRTPSASLRVRLSGLVFATASLLGRSAARSDHVAAAMVLRGFQGKFPPGEGRRAPASHIAAGLGFALAALCAAGMGRWW